MTQFIYAAFRRIFAWDNFGPPRLAQNIAGMLVHFYKHRVIFASGGLVFYLSVS